MSGLFGVMGVASRAMQVTQKGIGTTAHNIANASTPGYSRQRLVQQASTALESALGNLGTGVEQISIERFHEGFVERQLLSARSAFDATDSQVEVLAQVEEVLNEQQGAGLNSALSGLLGAFDDLASAAAPGAPVERETLRGAAQTLIDHFHRADDDLRELQRNVDAEVVAGVDQINTLSARIAGLNAEIVRAETVAPANDLRDQRDALVRDLASLVDVSTFEQSNGSATVMVGGGLTLVDGDRSAALGVSSDVTNPFNPGFSRVVFDPQGTAFDLTPSVGSGRLGGLLRSRDLILPSTIRSIDTLAYNLAASVNGIHAAGVGLDGAAGDFFQPPAVVEDAARDIALDARVVASTDAIAAGLSANPADNRNALELAALRDRSTAIVLPGDPPGPASGPVRTLLDHGASIVADVGLQSRFMRDGLSQRESVMELLENRRDEIAGVSLDEEVTNLIHLQAIFQANARVLATIDGLLEDVIALL